MPPVMRGEREALIAKLEHRLAELEAEQARRQACIERLDALARGMSRVLQQHSPSAGQD